MTANPVVFEKAIAHTDEYDKAIESMAGSGEGPERIYEALAIQDVRLATDLLLPVYQTTDGADGFVEEEEAE